MFTAVLISMVIFAIAALQSVSLRRSVVYLSVFSLLCSFAYLLYQAPDVAIAEAIIGCSLSTVLYLVAIKKYRIFRIYYSGQKNSTLQNNLIIAINAHLNNLELELDLIYTHHTFSDSSHFHNYDVIIEDTSDGIKMYGSKSNYLYEGLMAYLKKHTSFTVQYNYTLSSDEENYI